MAQLKPLCFISKLIRSLSSSDTENNTNRSVSLNWLEIVFITSSFPSVFASERRIAMDDVRLCEKASAYLPR